MELSADMLKLKGNISQGLGSRQRNASNLQLLIEEELPSPGDEPPYRLSNAEWSSLKLYTHNKYILKCIYMYIYHLHTCKTMYLIIIKKAINLRVKDYVGRVKGRLGKEGGKYRTFFLKIYFK